MVAIGMNCGMGTGSCQTEEVRSWAVQVQTVVSEFGAGPWLAG